jgi:hypothetical protein
MATEQNKEVMDKEQEVKKEEVATEATANPMADAPKKNAVAAEPSHIAKMADHEDLGQAVTKPTDSNPDASKNVKQVSGDPQQKSQGAADAMQAVKKEEKETKEDDKEISKEAMHDSKEDEKKKEEGYGKMKKEEIDLSDDVKALIGDDELTEEFKDRAKTVFEAAVKTRINEAVERMEAEYSDKLKEEVDTVKGEIVEKVDSYLNYVVEEWLKQNEIAIERGIKGEIAEDFITGLKKLFEDHYISVPDEKFDVLEDQAKQIDELKDKLNEQVEKNVELNNKVGSLTRQDIVDEVASDLTDTNKEKFNKLAEEVEYSNADEFKKKVSTIKESYFSKENKISSENEIDNVDSSEQAPELSGVMETYASIISKTKDRIKVGHSK